FTRYFDKLDQGNFVKPLDDYTVLELFAGAGGLAIGLEKAGLKCKALNEIDKWACQTLRENRPNWNVLEGDIKNYDFSDFKGNIRSEERRVGKEVRYW